MTDGITLLSQETIHKRLALWMVSQLQRIASASSEATLVEAFRTELQGCLAVWPSSGPPKALPTTLPAPAPVPTVAPVMATLAAITDAPIPGTVILQNLGCGTGGHIRYFIQQGWLQVVTPSSGNKVALYDPEVFLAHRDKMIAHINRPQPQRSSMYAGKKGGSTP